MLSHRNVFRVALMATFLFFFTPARAGKECELDVCRASENVTSSPATFKMTCGDRTQQIVETVTAFFYDSSTAVDATLNVSCNDEDTDVQSWVDARDGDDSACDVSALLTKKCEGEVECEIDIATLLSEGDCDTSLDELNVFLACGDLGIDLLTVAVLLMLVMVALAMGATTSIDDFKEVMKTKKRAFGVGFASQFGFMPLFSFVMAKVMGFSSLEAFGICLCGMAPGGSTSNLFTYWSDGNVALSIAMSAASTICAFFMIPLLYVIYIQSSIAKDIGVELPFANLAIVLFAIVVPVAIGMLIRQKKWRCRCGCTQAMREMPAHKVVEKIGSGAGALFLIVSLIVGVYQNIFLFEELDAFWKSWLLGLMFQPIGCAFGFAVARLLKLNMRDARAICMETGVQNYAVSLAIVTLSLKGCDRAEALPFVLVAMALYLVHSPLMSFILLKFTKLDEGEAEKADEASVVPADLTGSA